ncbi:hypothetical protein B296_00055763 [Ensete ventricosum]|uniref:Uncharacterized protein n=1 Tax=Ensete ventricosum TaxID=4639 RepID=A0A426XYK3_ENSVE|nr:hypothetical protein B296_00055763 [Ensete ventricosum]
MTKVLRYFKTLETDSTELEEPLPRPFPSAMASPAKKRKQPQGNKERRKRRSGGTLALDDLKALGHQLLSSRAHINNLPVLLSFLSPSSPVALALESLISLQSFFVPLFPEIPSSLSVPNKRSVAPTDDGEEKDVELVFKDWLRERFGEFLNGLIEITVSGQSVDALRVRILWIVSRYP